MNAFPEPMSPAQVQAARVLAPFSATAAGAGPLLTAVEHALADAGRRHDRARQQLLAEVDWLAAELADRIGELETALRCAATAQARNAALIKANDELRAGATGPLTVWRAYYLDTAIDGINVGLFTAEGPARTACEEMVYSEQASSAVSLTWWADGEDPDDPRELAVILPGAEKAFGTGYFVAPVLVQDRYEPTED